MELGLFARGEGGRVSFFVFWFLGLGGEKYVGKTWLLGREAHRNGSKKERVDAEPEGYQQKFCLSWMHLYCRVLGGGRDGFGLGGVVQVRFEQQLMRQLSVEKQQHREDRVSRRSWCRSGPSELAAARKNMFKPPWPLTPCRVFGQGQAQPTPLEAPPVARCLWVTLVYA